MSTSIIRNLAQTQLTFHPAPLSRVVLLFFFISDIIFNQSDKTIKKATAFLLFPQVCNYVRDESNQCNSAKVFPGCYSVKKIIKCCFQECYFQRNDSLTPCHPPGLTRLIK